MCTLNAGYEVFASVDSQGRIKVTTTRIILAVQCPSQTEALRKPQDLIFVTNQKSRTKTTHLQPDVFAEIWKAVTSISMTSWCDLHLCDSDPRKFEIVVVEHLCITRVVSESIIRVLKACRMLNGCNLQLPSRILLYAVNV